MQAPTERNIMGTKVRPRLDSPNRPFILSPIEMEANDRQAWLAVRRQGIGSSDAAKILGLSRWGNALTVFMEKIGEWSDDGAVDLAEMGSEMEETIARVYARKREVTLLPKVGTLQHPDIPWMLASPDFFTEGGDPPVVEIKNRSERSMKKWYDHDGNMLVPDDVDVQVQHQLAVTGYDRAEVAVLFGGNRLRWGCVERDDQFIADLISAEETFWTRHVQAEVPPAATGIEAEAEMLSGLWQPERDAEHRIALPPSVRDDLRLIADAKAEVDRLGELVTAAEDRIKVLMGEGTHGYIGDELVVTWKGFTKRKTATKELRAAHPAIVAEFTTDEPYRRFDRKWPPKADDDDE